jgi:hypothetical protein
MHKFFASTKITAPEVIEFLYDIGATPQTFKGYPDGCEFEIAIAPVYVPLAMRKATALGLVVGGRPAVTLPVAVGVFSEYSLEELMSANTQTLSTFLAAHEDELGTNHY